MGRILDAGRVFVKDGKVAASGTATFYTSGTTNKKDTFSDSARTATNANPIILNSDGELPTEVFGSGAYTVTVKDVNGGGVWTEDDVSGHDAVGLTYAHSSTGITRSIEARLQTVVYASDYVKMDGTTDDTAGWQALFDAIPSEGAVVAIGAGTSILSAQITHTNKPIAIRGGGIGVSILEWTAAASTRGIKITQDLNIYHTEVSGISFHTLGDAADTGLTIDMSDQLSGGVIQNRFEWRIQVRDLEFRGVTRTTDGWNWGFEGVSINHGIIEHCQVVGKQNATSYTNTSSGGFHISGDGQPTVIQFEKLLVYYVLDGALIENYEGVTMTDCNFVVVTRGVKYTDSDSGNSLFNTITGTHISAFENCVVTRGGTNALFVSNCYLSARTDGNPAVNFIFFDLDACRDSKFTDITVNGSGDPYTTITGWKFSVTSPDINQNNTVTRPNLISLDTGITIGSGCVDITIHDPHNVQVTTELVDNATKGTVQAYLPETKFKIADQEVVNSTTVVDDTEMKNWFLQAHSHYKFTGEIRCDSDTSSVPDIRFSLQTSSAFVNSVCWAHGISDSGVGDEDITTNFDSSNGTPIKLNLLANDPSIIVISGHVRTHETSASTVDFQWAQNVSSATRTRCRHGTWITFTKMGSNT